MPECRDFKPAPGKAIRKCYRPLSRPEPPGNYNPWLANEGRLTIGAFDELYSDGPYPQGSGMVMAAMADPTTHLKALCDSVVELNRQWVVDMMRHRDNRVGRPFQAQYRDDVEEWRRIWAVIMGRNRPGWREIVEPLAKRASVRPEWLWWHLVPAIEATARLQTPDLRAELESEWNNYTAVHGNAFPPLDMVLDIHTERGNGVRDRLLVVYRKAQPYEFDKALLVP